MLCFLSMCFHKSSQNSLTKVDSRFLTTFWHPVSWSQKGDSTIGCPKHNSKNSKLAQKYRSSWLFSCRVSGQDERWPCSTQTPSHPTLQTVWDRLPLNRTNTEKWRAQTVTVSRAARRRVIRRVSEVVTSAAVKMRWGQRRHVVMIWRVKVWSVRKVSVHTVMC